MKDFDTYYQMVIENFEQSQLKKHTANMILAKQNLCNDIRVKLTYILSCLDNANDMYEVALVGKLLSQLIRQLYEEAIK